MAKCINTTTCGKEISDGAEFCQFCGINQKGKQNIPGVMVKDCGHCNGKGECKQNKTMEVEHACEHCAKQAGVDPKKLFPKAPCAICKGMGFHIIDLKLQKPQQEKKLQQKTIR
jgi:DnaJ-class molecular chaperone